MTLIAAIQSEAGVSAIAGAVAGALLTVLGMGIVDAIKRRGENKKSTRDALEVYVTEMGRHLDGMIKSFNKHQIPHNDGRAFTGLYRGFFNDLFPYLTAETKDIGQKLAALADSGVAIDGGIYSIGDSQIPDWLLSEMDQWVVQAERLQGDLRVVAQQIRSGHR
jgi:hypothetical protein